MSTETTFITGALGFLGQHIVQAVHQHSPQSELRLLVRTPRPFFLPIESYPKVQMQRGELTEPYRYLEQYLV